MEVKTLSKILLPYAQIAIESCILASKANAALRGECRINQASADHFHHQNSLHTKNATRHESLLNALLYSSPSANAILMFSIQKVIR
ncbi:hypothetical protein XM74_c11608 [Vibrio vulnificus]|nr:hypothetical protein XM74_c11608 [Vibrio vulnificus]